MRPSKRGYKSPDLKFRCRIKPEHIGQDHIIVNEVRFEIGTITEDRVGLEVHCTDDYLKRRREA